MADISALLQTAGVQPKRTATELFSMAVENFSTGTLNPLLGAAFGVNPNPPINRNDGAWHSTDYAASIANTQFRPKLKFLFKVEFLFHPEVLAQYAAQNAGWKRQFVFNIQQIDRPKVDFEYTNVNQYNFRTRVLTNVSFKPLTMKFIDDVGNSVHEFFRFMMFTYSPITRRSAVTTDFNIANLDTSDNGNGMLFGGPLSTQDDAHRGVIPTPIGNAIKAIKISQFYVDPTEPLQTAPKEVAFFFINPRIGSFDLEDLSHDSNDPSALSMEFDFDSMVMTGARNMVVEDPSKDLPPYLDSPGDLHPVGGGTGNIAGNNNPYAAIIGGVVGKAASKITNELIGRQIRKIPGADSVASTLTGLVGGALGGTARTLSGGLLSGIGLTGAPIGIAQSQARPSRGIVSDSSVSGTPLARITTSTGGPLAGGPDASDPTGYGEG